MRKVYVTSDVGDVVVGTKETLFHVANSVGDGDCAITIIDDANDINMSPRQYVTCINGTFNIYNHDCTDGRDEDIVATISGKYTVYRGNGGLVFVKTHFF